MNGVFTLKNLLIAFAMSVALLLLSFVLIIGDSQTMAFSNEVLDTIFATSIMGTKLMWNFIWFGAAMLVLHLGFGALSWVLGSLAAPRPAGKSPQELAKLSRQHVVLWFLLLSFALLAFNSANFPRSSLGAPYALIGTLEIAGGKLGNWIAYTIFVMTGIAVTWGVLRHWRAGWRPDRSAPRYTMVALGAVLVVCLVGWSKANHTHNTSSAKPNIVLIGIDSLRVDMVGKYAPQGAVPNVRAFVSEATWFSDTMTPLARTFPSMISIHSGRDPHKTGAWMNLPPRHLIKEGDTLGRILGRAGYHSVFAIDEVRFANIDESYGFDQVLSPPMGATEFLLGMIADTPLSNFAMNSFIGAALFPHVHGNRGAAATYDPDTFVERIDADTDFRGPLFFNAHLTLAHWPYTWAGAPLPGPKTDALWPDYYLDVTERADRQFADLMEVMRRRGVLDNAIVVVYSDHGESFGKALESLVPVDGLVAALGASPRWGHGSTVFSLHQYKVVLAMKGYGAAANLLPRGREITAPASVMDIAPTLTQLVGATTEQPFDGVSLLPLLAAQGPLPAEFAKRVRFTETEYNPVGVANEEGEMNLSGILEAAKMYRIDPQTDRIAVREDQAMPMLSFRQYAAIGNELLLAAVPFNRDGLSHQIMVLNKSGGIPILMGGNPEPDDSEELHLLWATMQTHLAGIVPTGEQIADAVARTTVATSGQ